MRPAGAAAGAGAALIEEEGEEEEQKTISNNLSTSSSSLPGLHNDGDHLLLPLYDHNYLSTGTIRSQPCYYYISPRDSSSSASPSNSSSCRSAQKNVKNKIKDHNIKEEVGSSGYVSFYGGGGGGSLTGAEKPSRGRGRGGGVRHPDQVSKAAVTVVYGDPDPDPDPEEDAEEAQCFLRVEDDRDFRRVKLMCSYGGRILPRPHDHQLRYVGGHTHLIVVSRNISVAELASKLSRTFGAHPSSVLIKYQLPTDELDTLISVSSDEDLEIMLEELDRLELCASSDRSSAHPRGGGGRIRVFAYPSRIERSYTGGFDESDREGLLKFLHHSSVAAVVNPPPSSSAWPRGQGLLLQEPPPPSSFSSSSSHVVTPHHEQLDLPTPRLSQSSVAHIIIPSSSSSSSSLINFSEMTTPPDYLTFGTEGPTATIQSHAASSSSSVTPNSHVQFNYLLPHPQELCTTANNNNNSPETGTGTGTGTGTTNHPSPIHEDLLSGFNDGAAVGVGVGVGVGVDGGGSSSSSSSSSEVTDCKDSLLLFSSLMQLHEDDGIIIRSTEMEEDGRPSSAPSSPINRFRSKASEDHVPNSRRRRPRLPSDRNHHHHHHYHRDVVVMDSASMNLMDHFSQPSSSSSAPPSVLSQISVIARSHAANSSSSSSSSVIMPNKTSHHQPALPSRFRHP